MTTWLIIPGRSDQLFDIQNSGLAVKPPGVDIVDDNTSLSESLDYPLGPGIIRDPLAHVIIDSLSPWGIITSTSGRTPLNQNPKTLKTQFEDVFLYNRSTAQSFAVLSTSFASQRTWSMLICLL